MLIERRQDPSLQCEQVRCRHIVPLLLLQLADLWYVLVPVLAAGLYRRRFVLGSHLDYSFALFIVFGTINALATSTWVGRVLWPFWVGMLTAMNRTF